jgi:hypothetical protein
MFESRGRPDDECWPAFLSLDKWGYGQLGWNENGRQYVKRLHRVSFEIFVGAIPVDMTVDHICHRRARLAGASCSGPSCPHRACWNPAHLQLVTLSENCQGNPGWQR